MVASLERRVESRRGREGEKKKRAIKLLREGHCPSAGRLVNVRRARLLSLLI